MHVTKSKNVEKKSNFEKKSKFREIKVEVLSKES